MLDLNFKNLSLPGNRSFGFEKANSFINKLTKAFYFKLAVFAILALVVSKHTYAPEVTDDMSLQDEYFANSIEAMEQNYIQQKLDVIDGYWGYRRLARQVGAEEAYLLAQMIEHSTYPEMVKAIITVESYWTVNARSHMDAIGLMQIREIAALDLDPFLTEADLYDPKTNLDVGIEIFDRHMEYFDEYDAGEHWALTSYNRGRYATFAMNMEPPSTRYSRKVLSITDNFRSS